MSDTKPKVRRVFAHVRVHGLGASVEARAHGGGKPAVLWDETGQRVMSASAAAWQRGVRPGHSRWEAERRCPELIAPQPDPEKYEYFWQRLLDICEDYAPEVRVGKGSADYAEIPLDLTGTERLLGPAKVVGLEIRNRLWVEVGLTASVGIGPNRMVAWLACGSARPGEVVEVSSEEAARFVGRLRIGALPGADVEWLARLGEMGIRRAEELAKLPAVTVERALGEWGRRLWEIARGGDPSPGAQAASDARGRGEGEAISAQCDLRPPTEARERIGAAARKAAEEAARKLREQGQVGRQVRIELVFRDLRGVGARRTLPQPTRSGEVIFHAARALLDRMKLNGRLVRRVRVRVARLALAPDGGQLALPLLEREARRERLAEVVDRIKDRFGETAVARASLLRV